VNGLGIIAVSEGVLAVFIAGTWWWVLRQQDAYVGWRRTASLAGLVLPTVALILELVLVAVVVHYRSLEALDAASSHWATVILRTRLGNRTKRKPSRCRSRVVILGARQFLRYLVLAVNSFH
jgi:hypothetical protein